MPPNFSKQYTREDLATVRLNEYALAVRAQSSCITSGRCFQLLNTSSTTSLRAVLSKRASRSRMLGLTARLEGSEALSASPEEGGRCLLWRGGEVRGARVTLSRVRIVEGGGRKSAWAANLPDIIEAWFYVKGGDGGAVRQHWQNYLSRYGLDGVAHPLLKLAPNDWQRPFSYG